MPRVIRTPSAARDLDEIFDYIAIQGGRPATAECDVNLRAAQTSAELFREAR
ncbi:MAG: hypothetical protein NTY19_48860 [Planctomycetota bacterium]|nr:hypothetical protein [Planctomycetota bacterium]